MPDFMTPYAAQEQLRKAREKAAAQRRGAPAPAIELEVPQANFGGVRGAAVSGAEAARTAAVGANEGIVPVGMRTGDPSDVVGYVQSGARRRNITQGMSDAAAGGGQSRDPFAQRVVAEATPFAQGRNLTGNTTAAEAERQERLRDIDGALFSLRGNLNMRSKREMFTNLLEQKNGLTKQAYDVQNERDVTGARLANDMAQANAGFAEEGARRRDTVGMFNAGEDNDLVQAAMEQRSKIAELSSPKAQLELAKAAVDLNAADATAKRADDEWAVERDGALDDRAQKFIESYRARNEGATDDQAYAALLENELQGGSPLSPTSRQTLQARTSAREQAMNDGTDFVEDLWAGQFRMPFTQRVTPQSTRGTLGPGDLEYTPVGGLRGLFTDDVEVTRRGYANDPTAARTRISAEQAAEDQRIQNALRRRTERGY